MRTRTPDRVLQPLPALSKKETPTLSLKFWKWPRMPLSQYIAEGPEVPLKVRYGKYASSLNPCARHTLARVGHEHSHLSVRHVAPTDDFMAGLTVFTNDAWLNEALTTRVRELGLEATYHIRTNKPVSDTALSNLLLPSEPTVAADSPDGLASVGLGVRMPPRQFEVRSACRVLKRFASQGMTLHFEEARRALGTEEEHDNELLITVPADLTATELHAHIKRTCGIKTLMARCDIFAGMTMQEHGVAAGHMKHVTAEEYQWLRERDHAVTSAATAADAPAPRVEQGGAGAVAFA
jgi:hypothetical protein